MALDIKPDNVAKQDVLGRKQFAAEISTQIANYLNNSNESLVIGINGEWGSGKSTLVDFVKTDVVTKTKGITIVEFNPWMFSGKEALHSAFLSQFSIAIGNEKHKIRTKLKKLSEAVNWIEDANGGFKSFFSLSKKFYDVSVVKLKAEVDTLLMSENAKCLVLIDDIDRLTPSEMLEIFQLIKLNASFSNTVFLICYDRQVVKEAITNQYSFDGEKYLEKIIQVDYSLPDILPERIESLFFENLNQVIARHEIKFDSAEMNFPWVYRGLQNFFRNVRDIKRYFNTIQFRLPSFHQNVNIHDFLIVEAIRIFDYESYSLIKNNFKGAVKFGPDSFYRNELEGIKKGRSNDLYNHLFEKQPVRNRTDQYRISEIEFFDRYFSLTVSSKDVREEELQYYLNLKDNRVAYLGSLIEAQKIEFLLRRLSIPSLYAYEYEKRNVLEDILSVWSSYTKSFAKYFRDTWDVFKVVLASFEDENKGAHLAVDRLVVTEMHFNPARFLFRWYFLESLERKTESDLVSFSTVIFSRKEELLQSIQLDLRNFMNQFLWNDIHGEFNTRVFIICFAKYLPEVYLEQSKALISSNQRYLFKLLKIFVLTDSTRGTPFFLDLEYESTLLPSDLKKLFLDKVKDINTSALEKKEEDILEFYLGNS